MLVFSNLVISLLRNIIPEKVRIPSFVVVIATFVTIIDLLIKAFLPSMSSTLGIYIPLIVVNCIIFARRKPLLSKILRCLPWRTVWEWGLVLRWR